MSVTIKVIEKKGNIYTIQAFDENDKQILKSPIKCNGGKDKVESEIRKQFKAFNLPLIGYGGGGISIYWMFNF